MALNITELRQKRQQIVVEMRALQERLVESGTESKEDSDKFEKMEKDIRSLEKIIEREEALVKAEADAARSQLAAADSDPAKRWEAIRYPVGAQRQISKAEFERHMSYAVQGFLRAKKPSAQFQQEHLDAEKYFGIDLRGKEIELPLPKNYRQMRNEFRALNVADATKGIETIPEGFVNALEVSLLTFGGMRNVADVIRTETGNDLPWPTANDTANTGELLAEATTFGASVDPVFGQIVFKAWKYSSKPVLVSSELLQDSAFDLGARIGEMLGIRIGRIQNAHFTTGGGTTLPKGLMVAAGLGKQAADNTTFTADEVIDLEHSVDPAYRMGASFMMHDLILSHIRKLKESTTNAYIWQPGLQAGVPDRLLGYRYTINQQMASVMENDAKVLAFGDMSKYKIRDASSIRLVRLDELYAATDQVAFVAFMRSDGNLLDAGTDPVKYLEMAPS